MRKPSANHNEETVILRKDLDVLLRIKNSDCSVIYLAILRNGKPMSELELCQSLQWDLERVKSALHGLIKANLIPDDERQVGERRTSSPSDSDRPLSSVVALAEEKMGKRFTSSDLAVFIKLHRNLITNADVLLFLLDHCIELAESRYGPGRKPTLQQIAKEGSEWAEKGITDLPAAKKYIDTFKKVQTDLPRLKHLLGLADKRLSASEERYLLKWNDMGFPDDVLVLAFDKTVLKCQTLQWAYMDRVLQAWYDEGLKTVPEINATRRKVSVPEPIADTSVQDYLADVARMEKYLSELKNLRNEHPKG